jgi:hypothetical protein
MLPALLALASLASTPPCVVVDPTALDGLVLSLPDGGLAFDPANPAANSVLLSIMLPVGVPALTAHHTPIQARLTMM